MFILTSRISDPGRYATISRVLEGARFFAMHRCTPDGTRGGWGALYPSNPHDLRGKSGNSSALSEPALLRRNFGERFAKLARGISLLR